MMLCEGTVFTLRIKVENVRAKFHSFNMFLASQNLYETPLTLRGSSSGINPVGLWGGGVVQPPRGLI